MSNNNLIRETSYRVDDDNGEILTMNCVSTLIGVSHSLFQHNVEDICRQALSSSSDFSDDYNEMLENHDLSINEIRNQKSNRKVSRS
jgi:hypothetical protein